MGAGLCAGVRAADQPERSVSRIRAWPLGTPPFYALPLCAGITGLITDGSARVIGQEGAPIAGLYAAGGCTGGLKGGGFAGYVGGLAKASLFGMLAGETTVAHIAQARATAGGVEPAVCEEAPRRGFLDSNCTAKRYGTLNRARYSMMSARSAGSVTAYPIFWPGTNPSGLASHRSRVCAVQTIPDFFTALEYE